MLESVYFLLTQETRGKSVHGSAAGDAPAHQNKKGTFGYEFSDSLSSTSNAAYIVKIIYILYIHYGGILKGLRFMYPKVPFSEWQCILMLYMHCFIVISG